MKFKDRFEAGRFLADELKRIRPDLGSNGAAAIVLGLPRGGVATGQAIAQSLGLQLDVLVVRKLGAPDQPELAIGAIAEDDVVVLNEEIIQQLGYSDEQLQPVVSREQQELVRRLQLYRQGRPLPDLSNQTVILADDGLATGMTALAAIHAVKRHQPAQLILATPVCASDSARQLEPKLDALVCLEMPHDFRAVGQFYEKFESVSDEQVVRLLALGKSSTKE
jgi:putative phosphoribosyl transferase